MFTKFLELPVELQARVWHFAACVDEDSLYHLVGSSNGQRNSRTYVRATRHQDPGDALWSPKPDPGIIHVSRSARTEALKVYTRMPCTDCDEHQYAYFNTLHSTFYLDGSGWRSFKLLIDCLIKQHTTRPLRLLARQDLESFHQIRYLAVELLLFATKPARIWTEFTNLKILTIVFHNLDTHLGDMGFYDSVRGDLDLRRMRPHTKLGKRRPAIIKMAIEAFGEIKKEVPEWRVPKVDAMVRCPREVDDDDNCYDIEEQQWWWHEEEDKVEKMKEDVVDDSEYYKELKRKMIHTVSMEEIKKLKRKHHPSRRHGFRGHMRGIRVGATTTDSEGDGADV